MSAEVIAFPTKGTPAEEPEDCYGPPAGTSAWICNPCKEDPEVDPTGEFCFYVTPDGIHCWTCRRTQQF